MSKNRAAVAKRRQKIQVFDIVLVFFFLIVLVVTLYPFLNVLAISFNDATDTMRNINFVIPRQFTLQNYKYVFEENDIVSSFLISVARTLIGTLCSLVCTSMLAYVLSRKDFYFNKLFTIVFVLTMYVSGGMIPEYLLIKRSLGLGNNFLVYIIPGIIWVYNVILVRSYIEGLPYALQEAAMIDGANDLYIWARVIVPLCKPVNATVALFYAVGQWNSFMDTFLYAQNLQTLQYKLYLIMQQATIKVDPHSATATSAQTITPLAVRMAVTIIATVPILIVYPFLQKYFVGGMTLGAVKD